MRVSLSGTRGELTPSERSQLERAVNWTKGLHKDAIHRNLVVATDERLLLLGPQTIPLGVTLTLSGNARMMVL